MSGGEHDHPAVSAFRRVLFRVGLPLLVIAWLIAGTTLLIFPIQDKPLPTDAILVLGPPGSARLDEARKLIDAGVSTNLVISVNSPTQRPANALCRNPPVGVNVTCFRPSPATTLGEGRQLQTLIDQHGWKTVTVVTSKYHVSRARFIVNHCVNANVRVIAASTEKINVAEWAYQYAYQTAGYVKALVQYRC